MTSVVPLALYFVGLAFLVYLILNAVYRLYLDPLAEIPGAKIAALTVGYEMYYDLVQKARFPWKIEELHEQYGDNDERCSEAQVEKRQGPIVRISPIEVHINDPTYSDVHFSSSNAIQHNKFAPHQHHFGMGDSTFNTIDAEQHRIRGGAIASFLPRRSILALEPMLQEKIGKVCSRLTEFDQSKRPVDLRLLFSCMTTDIITDYAFPHCLDLLSTLDLSPACGDTFAQGLRNFQWFKHFHFLWTVLRSIPHPVLKWLSSGMTITLGWERGNQNLVNGIVDSHDPTHQKPTARHPTIFHELLSSDLPRQEKSYESLWQEGSSLTGAGVETTSNTLNVTFFHLLQNLHCSIDSRKSSGH